MKTFELFSKVRLVVSMLWVAAGIQGAAAVSMDQRIADLQRLYFRGHLGAERYEVLKYEAREQALADARSRYHQGHLGKDDLEALTKQIDQTYAASYCPLTPDERARLEPTLRAKAEADALGFSPAPGGDIETGPSDLNGEVIEGLRRRYLAGHLSAAAYERRKAALKHQALTQLENQYWGGHISHSELRQREDALEREYAGVYSPLTDEEKARWQRMTTASADGGPRAGFAKGLSPAPTGDHAERSYPIPSTKTRDQQLEELLKLYRADLVTPHQYQEQRAKILASPGP